MPKSRPRGYSRVTGKPPQEQERLHMAALEAAANGVVITDTRGTILWVNPAFSRLTGYPAEEVVGQNPRVLKSGEHDPLFYQYMWKTIMAGEVWDGTVVNRRKDGSLYTEEQTITPVRNQRGEVTHFIAIKQDVTDRKRAEVLIREANERLREKVDELEKCANEISLLNQMGASLQSAATCKEAYDIITRYAQRLFPGASGDLCEFAASRNHLEAVATWGETSRMEHVIAPQDCWALRCGRPHLFDATESGERCQKMEELNAISYSCWPLVAQSEALGVLRVWRNAADDGQRKALSQPEMESEQRLCVLVAHQIALALANLKLRETLRSQSIHDPLTGLLNRRYMEESLERELRRAARSNQKLALIMFDLDQFKKFNDVYGHEGGDVLLRELGKMVQTSVRKGDIACRYGGDEFILILHEASAEIAEQRAQSLGEAAKSLNVPYRGHVLGPISLSLGVGVFPDHGSTGAELLRAADAALYHAKSGSRDRTAIA